MRINARLDDSYEEQLAAIQKQTGKTRTEILKEALDLYIQEHSESASEIARYKNQQILEILKGSNEGPEDLSENYKEYLDEGLRDKHGIR